MMVLLAQQRAFILVQSTIFQMYKILLVIRRVNLYEMLLQM